MCRIESILMCGKLATIVWQWERKDLQNISYKTLITVITICLLCMLIIIYVLFNITRGEVLIRACPPLVMIPTTAPPGWSMLHRTVIYILYKKAKHFAQCVKDNDNKITAKIKLLFCKPGKIYTQLLLLLTYVRIYCEIVCRVTE